MPHSLSPLPLLYRIHAASTHPAVHPPSIRRVRLIGLFPRLPARIPPGEPTDGAAVKMPCTPDWERLLNEPCADAIMHQINHSPDSVVFDPYGSLRFEPHRLQIKAETLPTATGHSTTP